MKTMPLPPRLLLLPLRPPQPQPAATLQQPPLPPQPVAAAVVVAAAAAVALVESNSAQQYAETGSVGSGTLEVKKRSEDSRCCNIVEMAVVVQRGGWLAGAE
jgi:hypothetical protein